MKTHVRRWVLVVAALAMAPVLGCSKDKGGGGGAVSAQAKGALQMLPKDADMVMGIDFAALRSSGLYKKYEPQLMALVGDKLAKFKAECGFDPIQSLGSMTASIKGDKPDQDVVAVITGFKKDQIVDCMKKAADKEGKKLTVDGDYVEFESPKGPMGIRFAGDSMIIHKTPQGFATRDMLDKQVKQAEGDSPVGSSGFMEVFGKVNTKAGVWLVVNGGASAMRKFPAKVKAVWATIALTDGLKVDAGARMESEADAKQFGDMARKQMDQVKGAGMLDEAAADVDGSDINIKIAMSQEQLEMMAGMMKGFLGAKLGGGGMGGMDDDMGGP